MKLKRKDLVLISFMLFSLFFGAGNLIFPPFLGQMAGDRAPMALLGFLVTAVVLPVLGTIVVAKYDGLEPLARRVGPRFALIYTILIYLSIGPGLGIPRAASVPFEMAVAPYLPESASFTLFMLLYSLIFFALACWLCLTPSKLVDRMGKILTPCLLILIAVFFFAFLLNGETGVAPAQGAYTDGAAITGFLEGYNTMDAIAALNFGLVIATTLRALEVKEKKEVMHYTVWTGVAAGILLAVVYAMLSYMGMQSSGVYPLQDNGAWTLRCIVSQLFGGPGAILLAAIFTLACLTTCVGLINSIALYFSTLTKRLGYRHWVFIIVAFSFLICNQGLNTILSVSVPILNAIYPVAIVLIVLGLLKYQPEGKNLLFSLPVYTTAVVSVVFALHQLKVPLGPVGELFSLLPFYKYGMGWVTVALVAAALAVLIRRFGGHSGSAEQKNGRE